MINNSFIGIVKSLFFCVQICNRITALDWRQNLVLAQNIENWTEHCLLIIIFKIYGGIVTCHQFFKQKYAPEYIFVFWYCYVGAKVGSSDTSGSSIIWYTS